MGTDAELREKEAELAVLREKAARIVAAASSQRRTLTNDEDSHVLTLMNRARALEEEIYRRTRGRSAG